MSTATKLEQRIARELVTHFEQLAPYSPTKRKKGVTDDEGSMIAGWQAKAVEIDKLLKELAEGDLDPSDDESVLRFKRSALAAKKRLLAELKAFNKDWLLDPGLFYPVQTIIKNFREGLNFLFSSFQTDVNDQYRERVDARSSDGSRIECDLTEYLIKAHHILSECQKEDKTIPLDWKDVSCALALVTGRRQSELHWSANFEDIGDHSVTFTGQLKGKSRRAKGSDEKVINHEFAIPTLVRGDLVVAGLKWLDANGKRVGWKEGSATQVNKKWGKYLSQRVKIDWCIIPDEIWQETDSQDKWTYHKLRGLYFIACLHNLGENRSFTSIKRLAPEILCDGDIKAIEPYERINIKQGSKTQI